LRLAKIKLSGFKSFVEPTAVPITSDLVGIVGPNGCGKSNIIDAVRWVLGESKASALRGDSIQDVIFGGSANRKPAGRASVELIFDNNQGSASGQWSSYAEIAIKRIIQREGNSNYYINNLHVRRRDIADLFLGTGVGGRGYAIIEQGMISRIIEAKPQEMKMFLEEAAGISKYRERRHETELRLSDTHKNLVRIEDIANELRKQIEHLEIQANTAKEYNTLHKQLQNTQQILWLQQRNESTKQRLAAEREIRQIEQLLATDAKELEQNRFTRENLRAEENDLNEQLHETQGRLYRENAEKARIEQEIIQFQKNKNRLVQQRADIDKQLTENQHQRESTANHLTLWLEEKRKALTEHQAGLQKHRIETEKLPEFEALFHQHQKACENLQYSFTKTEQSINLALTHIQHGNKTLQQFESRINRLEQEYGAMSGIGHNQLTELKTQITQTENQLDKAEKALTISESTFIEASQKKETAAAQMHETQKTIASLHARYNALHNLQQKIENNDALKQWLRKHSLDSEKRLWHHIQIDKKWEDALESILQERLNSLAFSQLEAILNWQDDLPPGKLAIYELLQTKDHHSIAHSRMHESAIQTELSCTDWKTLFTFLTCNNEHLSALLRYWLDKTYVIDDLSTGLQQRHLLKPDEQFVTHTGHIINRNSVFFHSPDSHLHGVLSRQHELNHIQSEITIHEKKLTVQQSILAESTAQHEKLRQSIQALRSDLQQLTQQRHTLQIEQTKHIQINIQIEQRKSQIATELNEINLHRDKEIQQKMHAEQEISELHTQLEKIRTQLNGAKIEMETAAKALSDQHLIIQQALKTAQEASYHEKICQNKINDLELALQSTEDDKERLLQTQSALIAETDNQDDSQLNFQLEACFHHCQELEQSVDEQRNKLNQTRLHIQEIEKSSLSMEQRQTKLRESITQLHLRKQASGLSEERFNEQLREALTDEESLLPLIDTRTNTALQTDIKRLQQSISELGTVNLAALEELEAARLRESKLSTQVQDLREASAILQAAIAQIDQETKKLLKKTFDTVNTNLQALFPIIFSGGKAELVLSDDKILDAGVTLTAQPPGKKNTSLHLLSGGEKALTALALIFSLFRLNPAPFCLLDEVDAPLDDNNTVRFCELVKNLSKQTQFLFISHNKITMEIAQQLIGITMQEQGVSRVVAVNIDGAIDSEKTKDVVLS
jgi:chromosome segregation protein